MTNDNQVVIFISGRRYLYKKHIYNVLAYPTGAQMDVTYSREWIIDEIWDNADDFKEKEALIIGICTESGEDRFIPLRKVKLINLETDGSLMHIKFSCKDWVKFLSRHFEEEEEIVDLNDVTYRELITRFNDLPIRNPGETKHSGGKFVQIQDIEQFSYSYEIEAWEYIINKIGKMEEHVRGIFFRFIEIRNSSNKEVKIKKFDDNTYGYELTEGYSYLAKITFNFGKEPPRFAELSSFQIYGSELRTVPDHKPLEFRVYRSDFVISTPESPNNVRTLLFMNIEEVGNAIIIGPFLEIPIKLKKSNWRYASYILIITGLLITVISSIIAQFIYPDPTKTDPIIEFFIRIIGVFIATFGITLLRK